ncbi:mitochondrial chaperone Frataxin [Apiospora arundinis]|uniref:ferroxidase n=1 Tax=Apiospora arundinis TaxID=335852 RepID=A0ABR2IFU9_9PEZI
MTRSSASRLGRLASRTLQGRMASTSISTRFLLPQKPRATFAPATFVSRALFSTTSRTAKPLTPAQLKDAKPAELTDQQYHEMSDAFLDQLLTHLEERQDTSDDIDVEYSAGVMNISTKNGVYVVNKQPPNKQIWLSSPLTGPKRYDWVIVSEDQNSKQDTGVGSWVYLRDGDSLTELLRKEIDVNIDPYNSED